MGGRSTGSSAIETSQQKDDMPGGCRMILKRSRGGIMPFYWELKKPHPEGGAREEVRQRTIAGLQRLRAALKAHFPSDADRSRMLRIGTWNLREFGGTKSGGREQEPLFYIAEIISNFDIAAIQEVRANLKAFDQLCRILGPDWDHLATDVTDGDAGNGERMVFLYNRRRAQFRNIAGELTLPDGKKVLASFGERLRLGDGLRLSLPTGTDLSGEYEARTLKKGSGAIALDRDLEIALPAGSTLSLPEGCALTIIKNTVVSRPRKGIAKVDVPTGSVDGKPYRVRLPGGILDDSFKQFARTPYIVSFQAAWLKINLCTVHIYFGDNADPQLLKQRRDEIAALTDALGERAREELKEDPQASTLTAVLGDFNILSKEHETMKALENSGFVVPAKLKQIPGSNVEKDKAYDQIAFWEPDRDRGHVKVDIAGAGVFDFYEHVYRLAEHETYLPGSTEAKFKEWRTYKMSDHLPMWIELTSDFSDEYLKRCASP
jgi:hypothetical protein